MPKSKDQGHRPRPNLMPFTHQPLVTAKEPNGAPCSQHPSSEFHPRVRQNNEEAYTSRLPITEPQNPRNGLDLRVPISGNTTHLSSNQQEHCSPLLLPTTSTLFPEIPVHPHRAPRFHPYLDRNEQHTRSMSPSPVPGRASSKSSVDGYPEERSSLAIEEGADSIGALLADELGQMYASFEEALRKMQSQLVKERGEKINLQKRIERLEAELRDIHDSRVNGREP